MTDLEIEITRKSAARLLKEALEANERTPEWASRKLEISSGYMSQLMSADHTPSLELAFKMMELIKDLKKLSRVG